MIKTSTNFNTYNALLNKKPVWEIEFNGIATKFCSGTFNDIDANYKKYLNVLSNIPLTTNLQNFRTEFGGFDFEIIDKDNELLELFSNTFSSRKVTAKIGFQELDIADFINLPVAFVVGYGIKEDLMTYWFKCRNVLSHKRPIMGKVGQTYLAKWLGGNTERFVNGDCEDGIPTLNNHVPQYTNGLFALSAAQKHAGAKSCKFTATADGDYLAYYGGANKDLTEGMSYNLDVWVYLPSGQETDKVELWWIDDAAGTSILDSTVLTDQWVNLTGTAALTDETNSIIFGVTATDDDNSGDNTNEFIYVDDFSLKQVDDSCVVDSATGFSTAGAADWGSLTYFKIDKEIIRYTALSTATYTITRGQLGTQVEEHKEGAEVTEIIRIDETNHGLSFLLGLLTTTAGGANGAYDLSRAGWGLGIDVALININQIINELGDYGKWGNSGANDNDYNATIDSSVSIEDGLKWIEQNILALLPAYFYYTENGLLGVRCWDVQGADNDLNVIDGDEIEINPGLDIRSNKIITHVEIKGNYNGGTRNYEDIQEYELDESNTIYGEVRRLLLKTLDNTSHWFGDAHMRDRALERIFGRFGNAPVAIKMDVFLTNQIIQVGDIIDVTYAKIPLFRSASAGWTDEGCEVVLININYSMSPIKAYIEAENVLGIDEADIQDIAVFDETSIDDTTLTEDANHAQATLQAADAYLDQSTYKATNVMVELTLVQPEAGGGSASAYITFYIKVQNPANTDIKEEEKRFYYDETSSDTIKREFYALGLTSLTPARIRVDMTAHSGANAPTTVTLTRVKLWEWRATINTTDLK